MKRGYFHLFLLVGLVGLFNPGGVSASGSLPDPSSPHYSAPFVVGPFEAVPLYNQLPRWPSGCGPYSLAMLLNYTYEVYFDPNALTRAAVSAGLFTPYYPPYTSPENLAQLALSYGMVNSGNIKDEDQAKTFLYDQLKAGLPVIVDVMIVFRYGARPASENTHFVVVTGMDANNTIYVNDPLGYIDLNHNVASRRIVDWKTFWYMWQNNGDAGGMGDGWWLTLTGPLNYTATLH